MIKQQILSIVVLISTVLLPASQAVGPILSPVPKVQEEILAEHFLDLETRSESSYVNDVFKYNILLALEYYGLSFTLEPGEVFAFHENISPEFADLPVKTGGTKYTAKEGYKTVLGLPGNGVCHLASLMNWTATDAGLEVVSRVNHNFAPISEVPREYGTSIRYCQTGCNAPNQNLYIKNNFAFPVKFAFQADKNGVNLKILKLQL